MARVTLNLPEELQAKVQSRAGEAGYKTVEEYIQALLRYDADPPDTDEEDHPFPPHLHFNTGEELEALLIEGENSGPATEWDEADWESMRQEVAARIAEGRSTKTNS
jgi:antitoxin ParD1/3/4